MANICENTMYVSSPNKESLQQIHEFMNNWGNAILEEIDDISFEYYFDSRRDFPKKEMQKMTNSIKDTKGLHIRVLSIKECNYYAAYNVFEDGVWVTK
jgi:hypothetical protein